ncbi:MAG: energy transducer TonB [Bacteroidales bacterium]|nr:energy transducer TonB [Bacteroidales bacterium]
MSKKGNHKPDKRFIKKPTYPGGREAFKEFIKKNLQYPEEARKNKVEGSVHVSYVVNGLGEVEDAWVTHGIGYGCDEEAIRLVKMLKYEKVKNRGIRIRTTIRTRINFKLKEVAKKSLKYTYTKSSGENKDEKNSGKKDSDNQGTTHSYTINW